MDTKSCQLRCKFVMLEAMMFIMLNWGFCFSSHDNSKFASSGGDRTAFLWDVTTGNTIKRMGGHMGKINIVDFNEDATVLASG
jgi:WD40 repeat protein